jgi:hypothetical protein
MSKVAKQMYQAISVNKIFWSEISIGKIRDCKALQLLRLDQIKIINSKKVINLQSHLEFGVQYGADTKMAVARLKIEILTKFQNRCVRHGWGYKFVHTGVLRHAPCSRSYEKRAKRLRKTTTNFESSQNA